MESFMLNKRLLIMVAVSCTVLSSSAHADGVLNGFTSPSASPQEKVVPGLSTANKSAVDKPVKESFKLKPDALSSLQREVKLQELRNKLQELKDEAKMRALPILPSARSGIPSFSPSTGVMGAPSTGVMGAPSTGVMGAPSTGVMGAPSTGVMGAPSTGVMGAPSNKSEHVNAKMSIQSIHIDKHGKLFAFIVVDGSTMNVKAGDKISEKTYVKHITASQVTIKEFGKERQIGFSNGSSASVNGSANSSDSTSLSGMI